ncbi:MAG: chorismate synthase [Lachnospiraceae bacterium]|nr:chorismate synthase [Lachnospiraceae bacterium]
MAGSSFGNHFQITTWGESHGTGIGVVIDGCPAGLSLCASDIQKFLNRRKPGQSKYTTPRKEDDKVEILSGVFEGRTTGTPVSLVVFNENQRSRDYGDIASCYRPGHADYTFDQKYGFRDYRGGGRSSGRETIGRVAGGAVAVKILEQLGVSFLTYARAIGPVAIPQSAEELLAASLADGGSSCTDLKEQILANPLYMPDAGSSKTAQAYLEECMKRTDSAGGVIEGIITGVPAGIGEPVFDKLDACLAKAIFSIGAVKGFEIGDGFLAASASGSANNDSFRTQHGRITTATNHAGGILGGISSGMPVIYRAAVKPTPSIAFAQQTVRQDGEEITLSIHGRHDPVIVPRAVVVVESMAALTLLDLMLKNMGTRMDSLEQFYR